MRVERYKGIENYATIAANKDWSHSYSYGPKRKSQGHSWDAGVGFNEAIRLAKTGDPSLVEKTSEMVDHLVNEFQIKNEPKARYASSVAGSRVSVPEYLAGSPFCMKRKMPNEMAIRSIAIYVGTSSSAGINATNLLKRGATILALLEFLQLSQVAVELYLLSELDGQTDGTYIQVIQVESHPLDLSTASFAIAHPAAARQIFYGMGELMDGFRGGWPREHGQSNYVPLLRKAVGMELNDIYIPSPHLTNELIMSQPEKWLAQHIQVIKGNIDESL